MSKAICIVLSIALLFGLGYFGYKAIKEDEEKSAMLVQEALDYQRTIPEELEEEDNTEEAEVEPCRVVILVVDSLEEIKGEIDPLFALYGWEYKTDLTDYDNILRTYGDYPVTGSCDMSIKSVISANVASGGKMCITIGKVDARDRYSYSNIKNMLIYLNQYVQTGTMVIL